MKRQIITSLNPNKNFEIIGSLPSSTTDKIHTKVAAGRKAQPGWATLGLLKTLIKSSNDIKKEQ